MNISKINRIKIIELLKKTVISKLSNYKPETDNMPFHFRLLGRDRYALFSFIHSINTTFGMSIWEQIAVILANGKNYIAKRQFDLLGQIDTKTEELIRKIHYNLREGIIDTDINKEVKQIRNSIKRGEELIDPDSRVDLFVKIKEEENYFDITSAKPNMKEFATLKLKLLRWTALRLSKDKTAKIYARLAIPYNPYHPGPYERWTLKGLYDLKNGEILVGEEFWNFVAGGDVYEELLDIFEDTGNELRDIIDKKFNEFRKL